jgi:TonB family protein
MNATNVLNAVTVALSTAVLAAAVITPVKAATPSQFKVAVERSIDAKMQMPVSHYSKKGVATVSVRIDKSGTVQSANLIASTGTKSFDDEALRTAKAVSYPAGQSRNVVMVLGFGRTVSISDRAKSVTLANRYLSDRRQLLATETTAQPNG